MTLLAVFWISFLAATVLPVGSEPAVAAAAAMGKGLWGLLAVAAFGNYLGAFVNYAFGRWGGNWVLRRFFDVGPDSLCKARKFYARWGAPSLFFAWLPVVGDPLTVLAGVFRVHPFIFTLWVLPGKALRYLVVIWGVDACL